MTKLTAAQRAAYRARAWALCDAQAKANLRAQRRNTAPAARPLTAEQERVFRTLVGPLLKARS